MRRVAASPVGAGRNLSRSSSHAVLTGPPFDAKGMARFSTSREFSTVAKPELGTKRLCAGCGAKYYDLNKDPITCPKCGTVYEVAAVAPRGRPDPAAARAQAAQAAEADVPEPQEAEFVSDRKSTRLNS